MPLTRPFGTATPPRQCGSAAVAPPKAGGTAKGRWHRPKRVVLPKAGGTATVTAPRWSWEKEKEKGKRQGQGKDERIRTFSLSFSLSFSLPSSKIIEELKR